MYTYILNFCIAKYWSKLYLTFYEKLVGFSNIYYTRNIVQHEKLFLIILCTTTFCTILLYKIRTYRSILAFLVLDTYLLHKIINQDNSFNIIDLMKRHIQANNRQSSRRCAATLYHSIDHILCKVNKRSVDYWRITFRGFACRCL